MLASYLPFAGLTLSLAALWLRRDASAGFRRHAWKFCLGAAVLAALAVDVVEPLGCVWLATFALAVQVFATSPNRGGRTVSAIAIVALGGALIAHRLSGFHNPRVISGLQLSADAIPYRLHLNFDKTCVGLILLALAHPLLRSGAEWRDMLRRAWPIAVGLLGVTLVLSLAIGYVRFAPKFPREAWLWIWANLCFTCMAEEAFFRGFIQFRLSQAWASVHGGKGLALGVAAVLFGLAHFGGGPVYVVLATIAGAGYGWVYLRTGGRIEASILTHFMLNAVHFFGFTYPALQR